MTVSDDEATYNKAQGTRLSVNQPKRRMSLDDSEVSSSHPEQRECHRKPPTSFLHSEDWGFYLRICCHLRQIKSQYGCTEVEAEQLLHGARSKRRSCLLRLVIAFNHLYSEYVRVVDNLNKLQKKNQKFYDNNWTLPTADETVSRETRESGERPKPLDSSLDTKNRAATMHLVQQEPHDQGHSPVVLLQHDEHGNGDETSKHDASDQAPLMTTSGTVMNSTSVSLHFTSSQTPYTWREASESSIYSSDTFKQPLAHVCFPWCHRSARRPNQSHLKYSQEALRLARAIGTGRNVSNKHMIQQEYFDRICRKPEQNSLIVYQLVNHQCRVEHRIRIPQISDGRSSQRGAAGANNDQLITIQLPIALELILPKMQKKIERVILKCPFIYDPLEVAAELRQHNYDTEACVLFFQRTRQLRDIIHEFLPPKDAVDYQNHHLSTSAERRMPHCQNPPVASNWNRENSTGLRKFLYDIQTNISTLRRTQQDALRRLHKLRNFTSGLGDCLGSAVEDIIVAKLCNSPKLEKWILSHRGDLPFSQLGKLTQENRALKQTLRVEEERRKTMFNMMQEYLGNIRVYCRCREIAHSRTCIEVASLDTIIFQNGSDPGVEQYKFDRVFDCNATQAEVYTEFAPSVCSFLDGYNVCFLTYGGEASGKTYTLLGGIDGLPENYGIAHRALHTVLSERDARQHEWDYELTVAVVEIYNDSVNDLLGDEVGVHVHVDSGLERMMDNLESMRIVHEADIGQLLELCRVQRRTGRTALNAHSSRSHLILFARLDAASRIHDTKLRSILALCDLAGFEDIIKAETLGDPVLAKEAGYINRSLTALNRVFMSLRLQEPSNVSYRDSKLTYLLKPFFTYSGKCILIITVRTDKVNLASTQSTLRFGREARSVSLGRPRRQFNLDKLIDDMRPN